MRIKKLSREQLEGLAKNLLWALIGLGALFIVLALIGLLLLARGQ